MPFIIQKTKDMLAAPDGDAVIIMIFNPTETEFQNILNEAMNNN